METIGDRIRMLRKARDWTQDELARRLAARGAPVSVSAISQWERSETKNLKIPNLLALADELDTTPHYLWFGASEPGRDNAGRYRPTRGNRRAG